MSDRKMSQLDPESFMGWIQLDHELHLIVVSMDHDNKVQCLYTNVERAPPDFLMHPNPHCFNQGNTTCSKSATDLCPQ